MGRYWSLLKKRKSTDARGVSVGKGKNRENKGHAEKNIKKRGNREEQNNDKGIPETQSRG